MTMLSVLQHALGVDEHGRGAQYRSHFVTGPGCADHTLCIEAVAAGLMVRRGPTQLTGGDDLFLVTPAGRLHVAEFSPPPPKRTRSQQRYADFLEADSSLSFGEWLRIYGNARESCGERATSMRASADILRDDAEVPF